jgi:hypothetical protein
MKFLMAVIVYLVIGALLGLGIYSAVHGSYWFLAISFLGYVLAFAWIGCAHG